MSDTISITFPADRLDVAQAFGQALLSLGKSTGEKAAMPKQLAGTAVAAENHGKVEQTTPLVASPVDVPDEDDAEDTAAGGAAPDFDDKHVPFNGQYCTRAKVPFYTSGPRKGQWKKLKAVEFDDYDAWYSKAPRITPAAPGNTQETDSETPIADIMASVFGPGNSMFGSPTPAPKAERDPNEPTDFGQLMKRIATWQAAKLINQQDVNQMGIDVSRMQNDGDYRLDVFYKLKGLADQRQ